MMLVMALISSIIRTAYAHEAWWGAPSILSNMSDFTNKEIMWKDPHEDNLDGCCDPFLFSETAIDSYFLAAEIEDIFYLGRFPQDTDDILHKEDLREKRKKRDEFQEEKFQEEESSALMSSDGYISVSHEKEAAQISKKRKIFQKKNVAIVSSPRAIESSMKECSDWQPMYMKGKSFFSKEELEQLNKLKFDVAKISNEIEKMRARNRLIKAVIYCYMAQTVKSFDSMGLVKYNLRNNSEGSLKYLTQKYVIRKQSVLESYFEGYEKIFPGMAAYCYALVNGVKFPLKEDEQKYCERKFQYY